MKTRCSRLVTSIDASVLVTAAGCSRVTDETAAATAGRDGCDALAEAATAYFQKCLPAPSVALAIAQRFAAECKMVAGAPGSTGIGAALRACEAAYESAAEVCAAMDAAPCLPPRGVSANGAPCGADAQCVSGFCSVPTGGIDAPSAYFSFAVAQNAMMPAVTRGACGTCAPCGDGPCGSGLVCEQGTCAPPHPGDVGESCVAYPCKNGLQCDTRKITCAVPAAEGEACVDPQSSLGLGCAAPLVCQHAGMGVTGTCVRGIAQGGRCSPSGLACARGQCDLTAGADRNDPLGGTCSLRSRLPAVGQPCEEGVPCEYGVCASGKCPFPIPDGQACDANYARALRAPCSYFSECIAGACVLFDPASCG